MTVLLAPLVSYADARRRLLSVAEDRGATLSAVRHPLAGPDGDELATDVARFGAPIGEADEVVMVLSGVHGVEGHAGNGLQLDLVRSGRLEALPARTAVVVVHAVNPWGMAWTRRVDADNVDVNRNFVDPAALPDNPMYAEVDPMLNPTSAELDLSDASFVDEVLAFWKRVGDRRALQVLNGGQYTHPAGVQFGGRQPSWSRRTIELIWDEQLEGAHQTVLLDIHTGLGATGRLTVFQTADAGERSAELGSAWYPEQIYRADRSEDAPIDHGLLGPGFDDWAARRGTNAPDVTVPLVLEFGTLDPIRGITAFRADNWLHHHGDRRSETREAIMKLMRDQFYVDDDGWRSAVADKGEVALHTALDALGSG